jgi:glycosyltransferase involved in cell wall biosynthesis
MTANAVIVYETDSFDANRKKVMGRHVAGASFLEGFGRYAEVQRIFGMAIGTDGARNFQDAVERSYDRRAASGRPEVLTVRTGDYQTVGRVGAICTPDPGLIQHALFRRYIDNRAFSITGITHTISSHGATDAIGAYLTGPVQEWDALVCTSTSVVAVVKRILDARADFLAERIGARPDPLVQLPVIPLGVDAPRFRALGGDGVKRKALRDHLGVESQDVVVLFFGRLVMHAKAHPAPMLVAMQRAAERMIEEHATLQGVGTNPPKLHFVFTGQFATDGIRDSYLALPNVVCPDVAVHFLDGADRSLAESSWAAADIFMSLSDNIQESFGITPIEAMAAGLPCIVSDWDGYKDTVIEGETGFRIPSIAPPEGAGRTLARRYEAGSLSYDRFIGYASQVTAVSIAATSDAVFQLASQPELRRRLGETAQRHAQTVYDWSAIIPAYQDLWADLADRRTHALENAPVNQGPANPDRLDPFYLFSGHPTRTLRNSDRIRLIDAACLGHVFSNSANTFALGFIAEQETIAELVSILKMSESADVTVARCMAELGDASPVTVIRILLWLAKYGVVEIEEALT